MWNVIAPNYEPQVELYKKQLEKCIEPAEYEDLADAFLDDPKNDRHIETFLLDVMQSLGLDLYPPCHTSKKLRTKGSRKNKSRAMTPDGRSTSSLRSGDTEDEHVYNTGLSGPNAAIIAKILNKVEEAHSSVREQRRRSEIKQSIVRFVAHVIKIKQPENLSGSAQVKPHASQGTRRWYDCFRARPEDRDLAVDHTILRKLDEHDPNRVVMKQLASTTIFRAVLRLYYFAGIRRVYNSEALIFLGLLITYGQLVFIKVHHDVEWYRGLALTSDE